VDFIEKKCVLINRQNPTGGQALWRNSAKYCNGSIHFVAKFYLTSVRVHFTNTVRKSLNSIKTVLAFCHVVFQSRDNRIVIFYYPILSCFWKMISISIFLWPFSNKQGKYTKIQVFV